MTYLSRDAILQREDIVTEDVEVPEWGGTVRVRGMSGVERDKFEAGLIAQPVANGRRRKPQDQRQTNMENIRAKLCSWCCVDEQGAGSFAESDVQALGGKSAARFGPYIRCGDTAERDHGGRRGRNGAGDG